VLVLQTIDHDGGIDAVTYSGTNLQYPDDVRRLRFRLARAGAPRIESDFAMGDAGMKAHIELAYDEASDRLAGTLSYPGSGYPDRKAVLERSRNFVVYRDYPAYLASKRIYVKDYANAALRPYGRGYMLYLPEGYEKDASARWPLILFLHGTGDRGTNPYLLAKASPFMMIREKGPLPCVIVAPLLDATDRYRSFPKAYLDGVMDEALREYRIDERRIYLTGLSMGGEAAYRFALEHPESFAAVASLCGFLAKYDPGFEREALEMKDLALDRLRATPLMEIRGAEDIVIPLASAQATVADFQKAGVDLRFTILKDHDHDVWSDTYLDTKFYASLFRYVKE
jgi:predicted esterase